MEAPVALSLGKWQFGLKKLLLTFVVIGLALTLGRAWGIWSLPFIGASLFVGSSRSSAGLGCLALAISCLVPAYFLGDAICTGPYVRWFNHRLYRISHDHRLVGRSTRTVEQVLGKASDTWDYNDDGDHVTFNYHPLRGLPSRKFQVHCHEGFVTGVEMFDD